MYKNGSAARPPTRRLSPTFDNHDWWALDLKREDSPDWSRAVDIFCDRLRGRFIAPVDAIREHSDSSIAAFAGFSVIAIDCLVIETLIQFYRGEDETSGKHDVAFVEFLRASAYFSEEFDTKEKAKIFYSHFRCGILHQGQTKRRSLIRYGMDRMVELVDARRPWEGMILDRERFHVTLVQELTSYSTRIRNPRSERDRTMRTNFQKKMDIIAS